MKITGQKRYTELGGGEGTDFATTCLIYQKSCVVAVVISLCPQV